MIAFTTALCAMLLHRPDAKLSRFALHREEMKKTADWFVSRLQLFGKNFKAEVHKLIICMWCSFKSI
jgi:hypothetical protein